MDIRTIQKLEKLGFSKDWLIVVKSEWKPKKTGQYDMLITSGDPLHGQRIERTKFDNDYDLSLIHKYFKGNAYVIVEVCSNEIVGKGIIDYSVFDTMKDWTQENWDMYSESELMHEQKIQTARHESMIDKLTRENNELRLENARLRLQLEVK